MICTHHEYNFVDVREVGIDGQYCVNAGEEKCVESFVGTSEVKGLPTPSASSKRHKLNDRLKLMVRNYVFGFHLRCY